VIVYFRVDASASIGFGHAVRSLSLAKTISKSELFPKIVFVVNSYQPLIELVSSEGYNTITLPEAIDEEQFLINYFSQQERGVIIIDTLVNYSAEVIKNLTNFHFTALIHSYSEGRFFCNLAIYPAAHLPNEFINDVKWQKSNAKFLQGLKYSLLNNEVLHYKPKTSINLPPEKVVFIAGGSDPTNSLLTISNWINSLNKPNVAFQFLYGKGSSYSIELPQLENKSVTFIPYNVSAIANADMAICAFGVSLYELVYLNIPTLSYGHTKKHSEASERFTKRYGCIVDLGEISDLNEHIFLSKLLGVMNDSNELNTLKQKCKNLIDGKGVERITNEIIRLVK
jgi:spore coat polysaccharide biosynthesis predicted glycosyltransferase SpsG